MWHFLKSNVGFMILAWFGLAFLAQREKSQGIATQYALEAIRFGSKAIWKQGDLANKKGVRPAGAFSIYLDGTNFTDLSKLQIELMAICNHLPKSRLRLVCPKQQPSG